MSSRPLCRPAIPAVPLSTVLPEAHWKTALVEVKEIGGTSVNEGCTPTKTMVASARVAHLARRAADYGVNVGPVTVDMTEVRRRKRDIVAKFRRGSRRKIERAKGVDLFLGRGRFLDSKTVKVRLNDGGVRQLTSDTIFINTGARPVVPPIEGLDSVPTLDSTSIMELDEVPDHLLVIGGGYIGFEFGQMFRRFGSEVTIVQRGPRLLARSTTRNAKRVITPTVERRTRHRR